MSLHSEPQGTAFNLIVFVHGCCTDENDVSALREKLWKAYKEQAFFQSGKWEIVVFDWSAYTSKPLIPPFYSKKHADIAYINASTVGKQLADDINIVDDLNIINNKSPYKHIHLIAHSAGAKLIHEAAIKLAVDKKLKNNEKERPFIHLTFLDAYTPYNSDVNGDSAYGSWPNDYLGHYAEHYVSGGLPHTDNILQDAFNFDITNWKHSPDEGGFQGHHWPLYWYIKSITAPEPGFKYLKYGHPLSREGGNGKFIKVMGKLYPPPSSNPSDPTRGLIELTYPPPYDGVPIITKVDFPSSISGNGAPVPGTVEFTDSDAGVIGAKFDALGDTCGGCGVPFELDPGVSNLKPKGKFDFKLSCSGGPFFWTVKLTLRTCS